MRLEIDRNISLKKDQINGSELLDGLEIDEYCGRYAFSSTSFNDVFLSLTKLKMKKKTITIKLGMLPHWYR